MIAALSWLTRKRYHVICYWRILSISPTLIFGKNTSSMNFIFLLLTLFTLNSFVETCVKTIPPEEVYITSTELPTDKPWEVTDAPVTDAPVTDAPVTDAPVTDAPVTDAPTNECTMCMVTPPTSNPTGTDFTSAEQATAGDCKKTLVTCKRTDDLTCKKVSIQTSTGVLIEAADTKEASALLQCQNDGTYSFGAVTNIGQLSCMYEECTSCTSCDISKLTLPMPVAGANFRTLSNINQLECLYDTCAVPSLCAECDISAIAPTNLPTGAVFNPTDLPNGNCIITDASCARNDGKICAQITTTVDTPLGQATAYEFDSAAAHGYLFCGDNGIYNIGDPSATVTSITCAYVNCN
ncbi:hypothetical protein B9Z55_018255 [Caenorhabditis nigoni]|uniref:DUF281 domain-containing protein n=1 Tax=Caenorhabditis nigoni TaxID=1611254 RepID=A0A2G5TDB8_9PELO|nr:hypothetical protein B9Z55_018255 [Caenorhabditis nigoni]